MKCSSAADDLCGVQVQGRLPSRTRVCCVRGAGAQTLAWGSLGAGRELAAGKGPPAGLPGPRVAGPVRGNPVGGGGSGARRVTGAGARPSACYRAAARAVVRGTGPELPQHHLAAITKMGAPKTNTSPVARGAGVGGTPGHPGARWREGLGRAWCSGAPGHPQPGGARAWAGVAGRGPQGTRVPGLGWAGGSGTPGNPVSRPGLGWGQREPGAPSNPAWAGLGAAGARGTQ
jgi:hypothetical protein